MSDRPIIEVENLGKRYRLGAGRGAGQNGSHYRTLRESLSEGARRLWPRGTTRESRDQSKADLASADPTEFWALKDVSFEVKPGEVVGIIGRNGAGKSTLLKILSRITEPTEGRVTLRGRVASLLEVGTGFHPELTGRENIYLNGAVLGMHSKEIKAKFDEIVAFAEVERFLDTPVKRYSSGMYVRLAFAVAAHLEPEILIVDEVLAVGDAEFQKKCLGKMDQVAKNEGRTVLFVSHNLQAISTLTQRCLLLVNGSCQIDSSTTAVTAAYLESFRSSQQIFTGKSSPDEPRITRVQVVTSEAKGVHICGKPLQVLFEITTPSTIRGACLSFQFVDAQQRAVVHLWTFDSERPMCRRPGLFAVVCELPKLRLYMGSYTMNVYFSEPPGGSIFQTLEYICPFKVHMFGQHREFEWRPDTCAYLEDASWNITQTTASDEAVRQQIQQPLT